MWTKNYDCDRVAPPTNWEELKKMPEGFQEKWIQARVQQLKKQNFSDKDALDYATRQFQGGNNATRAIAEYKYHKLLKDGEFWVDGPKGGPNHDQPNHFWHNTGHGHHSLYLYTNTGRQFCFTDHFQADGIKDTPGSHAEAIQTPNFKSGTANRIPIKRYLHPCKPGMKPIPSSPNEKDNVEVTEVRCPGKFTQDLNHVEYASSYVVNLDEKK